MNDVFFSYRWTDWKRAAPIVAALEARGLNVWVDRARTEGFTGVSDAVPRGLGESKALLAFSSRTTRTKQRSDPMFTTFSASDPSAPTPAPCETAARTPYPPHRL